MSSFPKPVLLEQKRRPAPTAQSKLGNVPYYNAKSAADLLPILDSLIEHRDKILAENEGAPTSVILGKLAPAVFFNKDLGNIKPKTLYMRILGAWSWLNEYGDKDDKYKELRKQIAVSIEADGVVLRWRLGDLGHAGRVMAKGADEAYDWRKDFQLWLESDSEDPLEIKGYALSDDDIAYVNRLCNETGITVKWNGRDGFIAVKRVTL